MKLANELQPENISNFMLYTVIMFASIDYISILDYALKALLGGAIWFAFKLLQDHFSVKVRNRAKKQIETKEEKERV